MGLGGWEVAARPTAATVRWRVAKARCFAALVAQASCVGYFVARAGTVNPVAHSWPTTGEAPEESANESV